LKELEEQKKAAIFKATEPKVLSKVTVEIEAYLLGHCGDAVRLSSLAAPQLSRSFAIAADGCSAVKSL
jgi:hypothetical protein